jgi:dolichol-phosphate mannosyltransferase
MNAVPEISVVVPCHNEAMNLEPLMAAIEKALAPSGTAFEIVITDDRSTDGSWAVLQRLATANPRLRAQRFAENCGQSAAMWAGLRAARGRILVTLDADLQHDPAELPVLLAGLRRPTAFAARGWNPV